MSLKKKLTKKKPAEAPSPAVPAPRKTSSPSAPRQAILPRTQGFNKTGYSTVGVSRRSQDVLSGTLRRIGTQEAQPHLKYMSSKLPFQVLVDGSKSFQDFIAAAVVPVLGQLGPMLPRIKKALQRLRMVGDLLHSSDKPNWGDFTPGADTWLRVYTEFLESVCEIRERNDDRRQPPSNPKDADLIVDMPEGTFRYPVSKMLPWIMSPFRDDRVGSGVYNLPLTNNPVFELWVLKSTGKNDLVELYPDIEFALAPPRKNSDLAETSDSETAP